MNKLSKIRFSFNPLDFYLLLIVAFMLLAACSCTTLKKQQQKAESFYYKNPELLAKKAEQMFPNIIEGTTKGRIDTVKDVTSYQGERGFQGVPGEAGAVSVRIIQTHSTDTLKIESGVKVGQLSIQVDKLSIMVEDLSKRVNTLQISLLEMTQSRDSWRLKAIALIGIFVAFVGFKIFKKFSL